jgi:hypothetical protein
MSDWCILTDALPGTIKVEGEQKAIDTRTSTAIDCIGKLASSEDEFIKMKYVCSRLLVPLSVAWFSAAIDYLKGPEEQDQEKPTGPKERVFDYIQDAGLILSAFQQAYGLSYQQLVTMHWWHFLELFKGLPQNTRLMEVIRTRSLEIDPKDSPEVKKKKRAAKRSVALKDTRTEEQKKQDVQNGFNSLGL